MDHSQKVLLKIELHLIEVSSGTVRVNLPNISEEIQVW
jgi:hypothetical protein